MGVFELKLRNLDLSRSHRFLRVVLLLLNIQHVFHVMKLAAWEAILGSWFPEETVSSGPT